jgi:hypothetical protein
VLCAGFRGAARHPTGRVGHGRVPGPCEGRFHVVYLDYDLHPHAAGADEVGGTEMVLRGQSAVALETDADPARAHRHVPLGIEAAGRLQAQDGGVEGHRPLNIVHEKLEPHADRNAESPG